MEYAKGDEVALLVSGHLVRIGTVTGGTKTMVDVRYGRNSAARFMRASGRMVGEPLRSIRPATDEDRKAISERDEQVRLRALIHNHSMDSHSWSVAKCRRVFEAMNSEDT